MTIKSASFKPLERPSAPASAPSAPAASPTPKGLTRQANTFSATRYEPPSRPPVALDGAPSTLRNEVLGDGKSNCLEQAATLARPSDSVLLFRDANDGVGHAVVQRPNGSVVDPNNPSITYPDVGSWQAAHPEYHSPAKVPASALKQVLSLPPGPKRDAAISALGLSGVANRQVADTVQAGQGGRSEDGPTTEFGHALHSAADPRFGPHGVEKVQHILDQIRQEQTPEPLSIALPSPGDIMVWGPDAGDANSPDAVLGLADKAGHMAVVEDVRDNGNGTVTLQVSERNWNGTNEETMREITLAVNREDGSVTMPGGAALPEGVGFIALNNPRPGPNPTIRGEDFVGSQWQSSRFQTGDGWVECMGYIHDLSPGYGALIEGLAGGRNPFNAGDIVPNSTTPEVGGLMVWANNASGNQEVPPAYGKGHVAYLEDVQRNYDPPGDPTGRLVSYTLTISEANARGNNPDEVTLRTFTVSADANGQIQLPPGVGFYDTGMVAGAPSPASSSGGAPSSAVDTTATSYTIQPGDTLVAIANRMGVSVAAIAAANGITDIHRIYADQVLTIPR
ncbi:LysM peptidoglycan-binding domain-containing protein [Hyalangium gracile]|uniref:LysM peptidoglycan-binding domain-containing protein n=1 Tax=Hyalangium gracile TaxID=394092 RepID=UPI001CCA4D02|nr:LysM peptidoglycan-binding domain-containing protein [Hyalangium gracile]